MPAKVERDFTGNGISHQPCCSMTSTIMIGMICPPFISTSTTSSTVITRSSTTSHDADADAVDDDDDDHDQWGP
jgi:hypothetical protein